MRCQQPLAALGFTYGGMLLIGSYLPRVWNVLFLWIVGLLGLAYFLVRVLKRARKGLLFPVVLYLLVVVAMVVTIYHQQQIEWAVDIVGGQKVQIAGRVYEDLSEQNAFRYRLENAAITGVRDEKPFSLQTDLILYGDSDLQLRRDEQIEIPATVFDNPPSRAQIGDGAHIAAYADSALAVILKKNDSFANQARDTFLLAIKTNIRKAIGADSASLLTGMLLGDTTRLSSAMEDAFRVTGLSHILCVSGLHIALLGGIVTQLLQSLFGRKPAIGLISFFIMTGYVWVTGMSPSSMRALVMAAAAFCAAFFVRDYSPVNALGGTVLLFCLIEPRIVYSFGFLLSVAAVWAVCAVSPAWERALVKKWNLRDHPAISGFLSLFCSSLAVNLVTIPLFILTCGYTSLIAPIVNMMILPIVPVVVFLGLLLAGFGGTFVGTIVGEVCDVLLTYMIGAAEVAARMDFAILPLNFFFVKVGVCITAILIAAAFFLNGGHLRRRKALVAALSGVIFTIGIFFQYFGTQNVVQMVALKEEGRGQNSFLLIHEEQAVLIGAGETESAGRSVADYLRSIGIQRLEAVLIPTDSKSDNGGISGLLSRIETDVLIGSDESNFFAASDLYWKDAAVYKPLASKWKVFGDGELEIRPSKNEIDIFLRIHGQEIVFQHSKNPVSYSGDQRYFYNKFKEEVQKDDTTT